MDCIRVDDLVVHAIVGAKDRERTKPQPIVVNATFYFDFSKPSLSDELNDTVDYSHEKIVELFNKDSYLHHLGKKEYLNQITEFVQMKKAKLLEHLTISLVEFIFTLDERIEQVQLKLKKTAAISLASGAMAIVTRSRRDFRISPPSQSGVYLGLGSNLGCRSLQIEKAIEMIAEFSEIIKVSHLYETRAQYREDQPAYLNGVLKASKVKTNLAPHELLYAIKGVEEKMGRTPSRERNLARAIDIDILFYDSEIICTSTLVVPHPQLHERDFVIGPLKDICDPEMIHPVKKLTIKEIYIRLGECRNISQAIPVRKGEYERLLRFGGKSETLIMGILNVTPNSLASSTLPSEGSDIPISDILSKVRGWVESGSLDILDVGGESSRPGASPISVEEELRRVVPVIEALRRAEWFKDVLISVDTTKFEVAEAALNAGANIINDVSAGERDPRILEVAKKFRVPIVMTHSRGTPENMSDLTDYKHPKLSIIEVIAKELHYSIEKALAKIITDPGIGFAKKLPENIAILRDLNNWKRLTGGFPFLIGTSNKGFIGTLTEKENPEDRKFGTAATVTSAIQCGVDIVRVHAVEEMAQVVKVADAIYKRSP